MDLARAGFHAYSGLPQVPLRVFFVSLAAVVMVLDVKGNV
jgi:hypothetical protein